MTFESTIQNIIQRTPTVKSFQIPSPEEFQFKAGQFLEVTIKVDGHDQAHYFTISISPTETSYLEFTKRITTSAFSRTLDHIQPGAWVKISGPMGRFTLDRCEGKVAFLSGGIGITPILSICQDATQQKLERDIVLLYGNRSSDDIPFRQELDDMQRDNPHLRVVHTLDQASEDWTGRVGFINRDMIAQELSDYAQRTFFVCGPPKMVEVMTAMLKKDLNIPDQNIIIESFSGY